ncbi:Bug family tripartite tricarboxylate transporter substrate binding protein [Achromobacter aegrifaciens]
MNRSIFNTVASLLFLGSCIVASSVAAQGFPSKPIRIVVPNAAGGATDLMARAMSPHMAEFLGQPVVVENRIGAGGNIAATYVANAPADGHTIFFSTNILAANISLYDKINYDPVTSFSPISLLATFSYVLVTSPSFPAKNINELLRLLRDNPGKYSYASGGTGTAMHFTGALFKTVSGVDIKHIPYKGEAPAITDLLGGHVPFVFITLSSAMPYLKANKLRALAVSSAKRSALLPDVPTLSESALPTYSMPSSWFSMVAPAGTPPEIINKLNTAAIKALQAPNVRQFVFSFGGESVGNTPQEFAEFIKTEIPRWAYLVKISGAKVE